MNLEDSDDECKARLLEEEASKLTLERSEKELPRRDEFLTGWMSSKASVGNNNHRSLLAAPKKKIQSFLINGSDSIKGKAKIEHANVKSTERIGSSSFRFAGKVESKGGAEVKKLVIHPKLELKTSVLSSLDERNSAFKKAGIEGPKIPLTHRIIFPSNKPENCKFLFTNPPSILKSNRKISLTELFQGNQFSENTYEKAKAAQGIKETIDSAKKKRQENASSEVQSKVAAESPAKLAATDLQEFRFTCNLQSSKEITKRADSSELKRESPIQSQSRMQFRTGPMNVKLASSLRRLRLDQEFLKSLVSKDRSKLILLKGSFHRESVFSTCHYGKAKPGLPNSITQSSVESLRSRINFPIGLGREALKKMTINPKATNTNY